MPLVGREIPPGFLEEMTDTHQREVFLQVISGLEHRENNKS